MSLTPIELLENINRMFSYVEQRSFSSMEEFISCIATQNRYSFSRYLAFAVTVELSRLRSYGCVCFPHSGSHEDMNAQTFLQSTKVLCDFYAKADFSAPQTFMQLKQQGQSLEEEMFAATGGINTQKGLLFLTMLFYDCYQKGLPLSDYPKHIITLMEDMQPPQETYGGLLRRQYGICTIVEEAKEGFAQMFHSYLPHWKNKGNVDDLTMEIFTTTYDTTTIKRSGWEEYLQLRGKDYSTESSRRALNEELLKTRSTTGGVADMFSSTLLLALIDSERTKDYSWIEKIQWNIESNTTK